MSSYLNDADSVQLQRLRELYHHSDLPRPATPYRLGLFAAATSFRVDDYGAHSANWRKLFETGFTQKLTPGIKRRIEA